MSSPTRIIGSVSSSDTFYVSQIDTVAKCEGARTIVVVNIDTFSKPTVSISAKSTIICPGGDATFTAVPFIGGDKPSYRWLVNVVSIINDSSVFSSKSLTAQDKVSCIMISNAKCIITQSCT